MRFKMWLEDEISSQAMLQAPASSEVIRTGLQPQVDAKEIKTKQKEEHEKMMAIDGHIQRIKNVADGFPKKSEFKKIKDFCDRIIKQWDQIKAGDEEEQSAGGFEAPHPQQIDYMKRNQPLPENPRPAGPGTFGIDP